MPLPKGSGPGSHDRSCQLNGDANTIPIDISPQAHRPPLPYDKSNLVQSELCQSTLIDPPAHLNT